MRIAILLLSALWSAAVASREPPLVFMADEDPAMARAFAQARQTLDGFLKLAAEKPSELSGYAVKVGISEGKETEYFWITDFSQSGERFTGKIGNTPQLIKAVKLDQLYEFGRGQIVDWMYIDRQKRKMVGNFSLCALLTKEPPAQAEATRKRFNLDCN